jgi:hypothetical protein
MPNNKSKFAEVTKKAKEKRADANTRTAARKAAELQEVLNQATARTISGTAQPAKKKTPPKDDVNQTAARILKQATERQ